MICTTMAVLCGGKGTRLGKLTAHTPKSLVEVAGRPFLEWPLEHWAEQGIERVVLCIGHLGEQIQQHFGESFAGMEVRYADEGEPRGIDRALVAAQPFLDAHFWWTYGDTYLPLALPVPFGIPTRWLIWNDGFVLKHPYGWVDYGLYFDHDPINDVAVIVPREQRFYEINTPESLAETDDFLRTLSAGRAAHAGQPRLESSRSLPDHPA